MSYPMQITKGGQFAKLRSPLAQDCCILLPLAFTLIEQYFPNDSDIVEQVNGIYLFAYEFDFAVGMSECLRFN